MLNSSTRPSIAAVTFAPAEGTTAARAATSGAIATPSAPPPAAIRTLSTSSWRGDAAAGRAERHARREFTRSRKPARQQQTREVQRRQQEEEDGPSHQHPERPFEAGLQPGHAARGRCHVERRCQKAAALLRGDRWKLFVPGGPPASIR